MRSNWTIFLTCSCWPKKQNKNDVDIKNKCISHNYENWKKQELAFIFVTRSTQASIREKQIGLHFSKSLTSSMLLVRWGAVQKTRGAKDGERLGAKSERSILSSRLHTSCLSLIYSYTAFRSAFQLTERLIGAYMSPLFKYLFYVVSHEGGRVGRPVTIGLGNCCATFGDWSNFFAVLATLSKFYPSEQLLSRICLSQGYRMFIDLINLLKFEVPMCFGPSNLKVSLNFTYIYE